MSITAGIDLRCNAGIKTSKRKATVKVKQVMNGLYCCFLAALFFLDLSTRLIVSVNLIKKLTLK